MTEPNDIDATIRRERKTFVATCLGVVAMVQGVGVLFRHYGEPRDTLLMLSLIALVVSAYVFFRFSQALGHSKVQSSILAFLALPPGLNVLAFIAILFLANERLKEVRTARAENAQSQGEAIRNEPTDEDDPAS